MCQKVNKPGNRQTVMKDTSLGTCKKLADQIARGYYWLGVLYVQSLQSLLTVVH